MFSSFKCSHEVITGRIKVATDTGIIKQEHFRCQRMYLGLNIFHQVFRSSDNAVLLANETYKKSQPEIIELGDSRHHRGRHIQLSITLCSMFKIGLLKFVVVDIRISDHGRQDLTDFISYLVYLKS